MSRYLVAGLSALMLLASACTEERAAINRVGVNVVQKDIFTGSWYYSRMVIDVDYEAAGLGTFPGDAASDFGDSSFSSLPRVRWVIDEDFLYAFRDYEMIEGADGEPVEPNEDYLGHPVAAFPVETHFDIRRAYNTVTGEEQNVLVENATDRRWYEREYMRVNWAGNPLKNYYGQTVDLYTVFGLYSREPAPLFVQTQSDFPDSWRPTFNYMSCASTGDTNCEQQDQDAAGDYEQGQLYHFSFVNQEIMAPGTVPVALGGNGRTNYCYFFGGPTCSSVSVIVRNSFLRVPNRQYERANWDDDRFARHGYFRLERFTYDRSNAAEDPSFRYTDFKNYSINRWNIWRNWRDSAGNSIPYAERQVRPILWYLSHEVPGHLVKPSYELVSDWNAVFMSTVRALRNEPAANYPRIDCQTEDPTEYCFCKREDPENPSSAILNPTCAGQYNPFISPDEAISRGAENPYDCWVDVPEGAEPTDRWQDPSLGDPDFYGWFQAEMKGSECVNILRQNNCNRLTGTTGDNCQERGDLRYKFLSYVDQPGTAFLGISTLRGDPVTGELIGGDANIGGPALDSFRTATLQQYDILNGTIDREAFIVGEDVRSYQSALNRVEPPAVPRIDFNVALRFGNEPVAQRRGIDEHMNRVMQKAERLQGPEGRARIFEDRLQAFVGTDMERQLVETRETVIQSGMEGLPAGLAEIPEEMYDQISPYRMNAHDLMRNFEEQEHEIGSRNIMLPNAFQDASVVSFIDDRRDWTRARLEIGVNRMLYYQTQVHEMGHSIGLRHDFGGTADTHNYYDDYYVINDSFPLPNPADFDSDGTPGFNTDEQVAYEAAYSTVRERRERAGINRWMNSSIMDYTANWYERTTQSTGYYDRAAVAFGYGDVVEIYDNSAGIPDSEINPANTPRVSIKYYAGGEVCNTDNECPHAAAGPNAGELMQTNRDSGLTQTCVANPASGAGVGICSNFDDDMRALAQTQARWVPVEYRFCTDDRASGLTSAPGTIGWCNRFDEGDSYREIVANIADSYEQMYLFTNFRRYRTSFDLGNYIFNQLINRRLIILQGVYQNLVNQYANEPEYRNEEGAFGFYDHFLASADIMNFYARINAQPEVGCFDWNPGWQRYQRSSYDPDAGCDLSVPLGQGRYLFTDYQQGLTGIERLERIGTYYDKIFTMQLLVLRGQVQSYNRDVGFYTNFYDLFPVEMQNLFQGLILGEPEFYSPRVRCAGGEFPACDDPTVIYMDHYRGDCSAAAGGLEGPTCRPDPVKETYADLPVLQAGSAFQLQALGAQYALTFFPVFFDTSFQNQLFICVEGQGECQTPGADQVEGSDYVRFRSARYGRDFLAWNVEGTDDVPNAISMGFEMIQEARTADVATRLMRKYRGDLGGGAYTESNFTDEELAELNTIDFQIPDANSEVDSEIARLDGRLNQLESFFNYLIQIQRRSGIFGLGL